MGILDSKTSYTLRPMKYPKFFKNFEEAIANTWNVNEISFTTDLADIRDKLNDAEKHVVSRLVAFFATGDNIVNENLTTHIMRLAKASPELAMYYSRQAFEEAQHIQFYLLLLDNYLPNEEERYRAFAAIDNIPSIRQKADFCFKWMDQMTDMTDLETDERKKQFLLNITTFATAVEGLFFMGAFAYVYYLRNKGLLHGLASGTNWVFRDESAHMNNAFDFIDAIRVEYPHLWDKKMEENVLQMLKEALECEMQFSEDVLTMGIAGMTSENMRKFLEFCVDQRLTRLGMPKEYNSRNPFDFMELQDLEEMANFFERDVSAYQVGVKGEVGFEEEF